MAVAACSVAVRCCAARRRRSTASAASSLEINRYLQVQGAPSVVIPNFHEDVSDAPVDEEILARLPEEPFILYVGAFGGSRGSTELFAAYSS